MPRRITYAEPDNQERWVISYADFITLLFAFFVVMYSVSTVNAGKYKVLSDTFQQVFTPPSRQFKPTSDMHLGEKGNIERMIELPMPGNYNADEDYQYGVEGLASEIESGGAQVIEGELEQVSIPELKAITAEVSGVLDDFIENGSVSVNSNNLWIEVEIKSSVLFESGSAKPNISALDIVYSLASILEKRDNPVHVEGFTDNVPIANKAFPSNWELSSARAAAVVRLLVNGGIQPFRLAAVGYGEHQPVATNSTAEGRSRNRRVVLVISRDLNVRRSLNSMGTGRVGEQSDELEKLLKREINQLKSQQDDIKKELASRTSSKTNQPDRSQPSLAIEPVKPIQLEGGGLLYTADEPPQP